jgi:hypothetical protein
LSTFEIRPAACDMPGPGCSLRTWSSGYSKWGKPMGAESCARMNVWIQNDHLHLKFLFNFIILTYSKFNK